MAARRRTGFIFEATDPNGVRGRVKVLSYTRYGAEEFLTRQGYTNVVFVPRSVVAAQVSDRPDGGWNLNGEAFRVLLEREGIHWPVELHFNGRKVASSGSLGSHTTKRDGIGSLHHRIMVKNYLTAQEASTVLRHEVRHARQDERLHERVGAERFARAARAAYNDGRSWADKPAEIDAQAAERENGDLDLTRRSAIQTGCRRFAAR